MAQQYNGLAARIAAALAAASVPNVSGGDAGMPQPVTIASSTASAGPAPSVFTANVNPMTGNANHLLQVGDLVFIYGHRVNTTLNGGPFVVAAAGFSATTFSLTDLYGNPLYQNASGNAGTVQSLGFGVTYQIPNDLDPSSAQAWNIAYQAIGDRTALLAASTGAYKLASFNHYHADGNILETPTLTAPGLAPAGGAGTWFPFSTPALSALGTSISAIGNSGGLIKVTSSAPYAWASGQKVFINGCATATEANGYWIITRIDNNNFTLNNSTYVHTDSAGYISIPEPLGTLAGSLTAHIDDVSDLIEVDVSTTISYGPNATDFLAVGLGFAAYGPNTAPSGGTWISYAPGTTTILDYLQTGYISSTTPSFTAALLPGAKRQPVSIHGILSAADIGASNLTELDFYLMAFNSTGTYAGVMNTLGGITASVKVWRRTLFNGGPR